jgi:FixJ family two-component response regulator
VLAGIQRLVKAHGFEAELFESVQAFDRRANLKDAICLVLDIDLNGDSGIELRRRLTAAGQPVPVIFITASVRDETRRAAIEAGCVAYLTKPFAAKALIEALRTAAAASADL